VKTGRHSKSPCNDFLPSTGKSIDVLKSGGKEKLHERAFKVKFHQKLPAYSLRHSLKHLHFFADDKA
jgi:hypothetical protein